MADKFWGDMVEPACTRCKKRTLKMGENKETVIYLVRNRSDGRLPNLRKVAAPELGTKKSQPFSSSVAVEKTVLCFSYEDADGGFSVISPAA